MNYIKNLFYLLFLLIVSASLTGCFIIDASPDISKIVYMKTGETKTFKVTGPEISEDLSYSWYIDRYSTGTAPSDREHHDSGKMHEFTANPDGEGTNYITITCELRLKVFNFDCTIYGGCGWGYHWVTRDSRTWKIRVTSASSSPIWEGHYIIKNQKDVALLNGITEVTGNLIMFKYWDFILPYINNLEDLSHLRSIGENLIISNIDGIKNMQGLDNLESIGRNLTIEYNDTLTNLDGLSNIISINGGLFIYNVDVETEMEKLIIE